MKLTSVLASAIIDLVKHSPYGFRLGTSKAALEASGEPPEMYDKHLALIPLCGEWESP